jgi:hypothetical protein
MTYQSLSDFLIGLQCEETAAVLTLDNDSAYAYEGDVPVFRMGTDQLLEEALRLLDVPYEQA